MKNIFIVFKKELLDVIRDRRTIISMVVVPIVLFPVMTIGFSAFVGSQVEKTRAEIQKIAFIGQENYRALYDYISRDSSFILVDVDNVTEAIGAKYINSAIEVQEGAEDDVNAGDSSVVKIYYDGAEIKSEFTRNRLRGKVSSFSDSIVGLRLAELGATPEILTPLPVETENVASEQKMSGFLLSMFLPYMIIILTMVGATYPAIDLTAGEKERGTLETILASPASRADIAIGKFLTVFTTSLVTAMLAVTSLTLTAAGGLGAMANFSSEVSFQVEPLTFLVLLMLMIPVACLFSSVLLTLSLFAKSYKEAQSYVTPLMFVIILPAMVTFTPGIELNTKLALIPVVNVSLVAKEALLGTFNWGYIGIVFFSTAVLAAIALFIAKRQFDREEVLFRI